MSNILYEIVVDANISAEIEVPNLRVQFYFSSYLFFSWLRIKKVAPIDFFCYSFYVTSLNEQVEVILV